MEPLKTVLFYHNRTRDKDKPVLKKRTDYVRVKVSYQ